MNEDFKERLVELNLRVNYHDREITALKEANKELVECLQSIRDILTSVKWLLAGSSITIVAYSIGVFEAVKTLFL